jgi:hypothetical protein
VRCQLWKQPAERSSHDARLDCFAWLASGQPQGALKGQAMAEFALVLPALLLLLSGMFLAGFYAFRAAAADWGVFMSGVTAGAYPAPADSRARLSVAWPDIGARLRVELDANSRQARSRLDIQDSRPWMFGIELEEAQRGSGVFRLWRFYPGPPKPGGVE